MKVQEKQPFLLENSEGFNFGSNLDDVIYEYSLMCNKNWGHSLTQSKFKTITRNVHGKFNCITVKYNGT